MLWDALRAVKGRSGQNYFAGDYGRWEDAVRESGGYAADGSWPPRALVEGDQALAFEQLLTRELKTATAWAFKETFVEFCSQPDGLRAKIFFEQWHESVIRSKLEPLKKVARMLQSHLSGLLNYFDHPIANAITEGFNSRIQALKAAARGFRSFANYRTRILFFCGKLDLPPILPLRPCH